MNPAHFVLDSSFLIKFHREQPHDIYVTLWDRLSTLLAQGEAVIPREADREMQRRDDELRRWLRGRQASVVEATVEELAIVQAISQRFPAWVRGQKNGAARDLGSQATALIEQRNVELTA